ncbi:hypothetical protein [Pseudotabrizicola sp. 4114]
MDLPRASGLPPVMRSAREYLEKVQWAQSVSLSFAGASLNKFLISSG